MVEPKHNILIVEDDLDVAEMLDSYFQVQGYGVVTVHWGEDVIKACNRKRPDLILLDIRLPDIDGYQVAQRLKEIERTKNIPILFLTEKRTRTDKLQGLELGAEDYITKPFDIQELRLRVKNVLQRSSRVTMNSPITGLPDQVLVDEKLRECLDTKKWALLLVTVENYRDFREKYTFFDSDEILRAVTLMIKNAVRNEGSTSDFIGHLAPHQFLIVTHPDSLDNLQRRLKARFEQNLDYFYPIDDAHQAVLEEEKKLSLSIKTLNSNQGLYQNIQAMKDAILKMQTI